MTAPCARCRTSSRACDHKAEHYPYKPCCTRCSHPKEKP